MLLRVTQGVLVVTGIAMLAWCAWIVVDAAWSQQQARYSLETVARPDVSGYARDIPAVTATRPGIPTAGAAIGDLEIPRVQLSAVVLHGSDTRTLRRGPGHLEHTPLPGESGNVVIAGHRDTFFRELRDVQIGDDVFLNAPQGRFHYQVTSTRVVNAHDLSVIEPTDEDALTLITCFPFWVLGPAPDRFIVRAVRVDQPAAATLRTTAPSTVPTRIEVPPAVRRPEPPAPPPEPVADEVLVRRAIRQFEFAYNGRMLTHNELRPGAILRLDPCAVMVEGDGATATCDTPPASEDDTPPSVWTLMLERTAGAWAIKSIRTN